MTSTTPPPLAVTAPASEAPTPGTAPRRFGAARAVGLAIAAFLGGYLAHLALSESVDIVRERLFSLYDPFGGQAAVGRFRLLSLLSEGFGALAGIVAIIGIAARRWAIGVLVLTVLSVLCHVGFAAQVLDTTYRSLFLEPGRSWNASYGLPFSITVIALQLLIVILCLVRGPRPEPIVIGAPPAVADTPPPALGLEESDERLRADDEAAPAAAVVAEDEAAEDAATEVEDEAADQDVYLVIHGREYGPYPPERVRGFMVEGRIHPGTLVRIGGETKPASEVPAIFGS